MSALTTVDTDLACYDRKGGDRVVVSRLLGSPRKTEPRKTPGKKNTNKITRRNPESHVSPGARRPKSARDANAKGMASKLTWTLVALRAATEPTKEEAMQDIVVDLMGVKKECECAGMTRPVDGSGHLSENEIEIHRDFSTSLRVQKR